MERVYMSKYSPVSVAAVLVVAVVMECVRNQTVDDRSGNLSARIWGQVGDHAGPTGPVVLSGTVTDCAERS